MRKPSILLLLCFGFLSPVSAMEFVTGIPSESEKTSVSKLNTSAAAVHAEFKLLAKQQNVRYRDAAAEIKAEAGYYTITGVFGSRPNVNKLINKYRKLGLDAGFVYNEAKGLHYVYTNRFENGVAALEHIANDQGRHPDLKNAWILHFPPEQLPSVELPADNAPDAEPKTAPAKPNTSVKPAQRAKEKQPNSKLLQRADDYFNKMWYAEAAKIYEDLLAEDEKYKTFEIISRVGDSHYFNTNMERAHHWYEILYKDYRDEMSAENLFKYAHALKGTGKYGRAKRFMRLYQKKMKEPGAQISDFSSEVALPTEVILDNILQTEHEVNLKNVNTNSRYSDFSPMFHGEDELVFSSSVDSAFFSTRRYKWNNQPYLDLYVAKLNEESSDLRDATKFSKKINTKYHEASVAFSPDNTTMYFTRNNYKKKLKRDKKGVNHLKIFRSVKVNGQWQEPQEMPFNSDSYSTGHPALSADGKLLYFVSDMPGSLGETDIFVVDVLENGTYSSPRNLGPKINTDRKEMFPFVTDKKLYFSSNGHVGLGGLDIFESEIDEEEGFLQAVNLGKPINSNKDDFSYIVREETQEGFFASNRPGGKGDDDIYSFKRLMPEEEHTNAIDGVITDLITGDVMPEALVELLDENNIKIRETTTDAEGRFIFEDLDSNTKYVVKGMKDTYADVIMEAMTTEDEVVSVDLEMKRLNEMIVVEDGIRKLKIENIYFNFDRFNIRSDAAEELDKLVAVMKEYPTMVIKIESHTDSRGPKAYNRYLSDKRAKSTRDYLISQGIDPSRIASAIGYGEDRLLNECDGTVRCSREKHQLNRRSEFIIVKM